MAEAPTHHHVAQFEAVVTRVISETPDTVTLELFAPHAPTYKAGQFLTVDPAQFLALRPMLEYLQQQKGKKELVRAYSLSSAPHENRLAFTVKEEPSGPEHGPYPPLLSPLLTYNAYSGMALQVTGFTGTYVLADDVEQRADTLLHVVAGSGSVPNFSILKHALHADRKLKHVFVYSSRTVADVIFRAQLDAIARRHPERVKLVHLLTREPDASRHGADYRHARVTIDLLRELLTDPARTVAYVCGPGITMHQRKAALAKGEKPEPRFLEQVVEMLKTLGLDRKQIHQESYG